MKFANFRALSLYICVLTFVVVVAHGQQSAIVPPLHTEAYRIVDAAGHGVRLTSVNWYGFDQKEYVADMIYDELDGNPTERTIVDIADVTIHRRIPGSAQYRDLLVPIFRRGDLVYERPSIHQMRGLVQSELGRFYSGVKRLLNPHIYPVGLELGLYQFKSRLMHETRKVEFENRRLD